MTSHDDLPALVIRWDPESQSVPAIQFDKDVFKCPLFVISVLEQAKTLMEDIRRLHAIQLVQEQQSQALLAEKLKRQLHLG